jgi:hypothetical protein
MYYDNDNDNDNDNGDAASNANVRVQTDGGTDESGEDPFGEAMDAAESATADGEDGGAATDGADNFDVEAFLEAVSEGEKTKMLSIRVTPEMHQLWRELREDPSVKVDVPESIRNHIETLAHRHPSAAERAGRKLAIERELRD